MGTVLRLTATVAAGVVLAVCALDPARGQEGVHEDAARPAVAAVKSAPADPLMWVPGKPVLEVKAVLPEAQYQARKKTVMANVQKEGGLENVLYPRAGLLLNAVDQSGRAYASGIREGEVITAGNWKPIPDGELTRIVHGKDDFTLTVCKPGSEERDVTFTPGRIGIGVEVYFDFARYYWDQCTHDPRWDEDVIVAARQCNTNADLAETALAHAQAAGWNDPFFQVLACEVYCKAGRYEDAAPAPGLPLLPKLPKELRARVADNLNLTAKFCYHWNISEQLHRDYPDDFQDLTSDTFAALAAYQRGLPAALRISRPPVEVAAEVPSEDLTNQIADVSPFEMVQSFADGRILRWKTEPFDIAAWQTNHSIDFQEPTGKFASCHIGPALENGLFSVEFKCRAYDKMPAVYGEKSFVMGLIDYSPGSQQGRILLMVEATPSGYVYIASSEFGSILLPHVYTNPWKTSHRASIIFINQRMQVLIDGVCVFDWLWKPMYPEGKLLGYVYVPEMDVHIDNLEWRKLNVPAAATQGAGNSSDVKTR